MSRARALGVCVLALLPVLAGCTEPDPGAEILEGGLAYLLGVQNEDGGFPASRGAASDFSTSAWVALALAAAETPPANLDQLRAYLAAQAGAVERNETGSLSRVNPVSLYVLSGLALGVPAARWNGTDPVDRLRGWLGNESIAINERLFLLGALSATGHASEAGELAAAVRAKLLDPADEELSGDAWMRAHAILALLASGDSPQDPDIRSAARSLLAFQVRDAGFRGSPDYAPDASTTAAVVAVLSKVRFVYSHERTTGLEFIAGLQQDDGSVRFSEELDFGPVKTTSEAILAATGKGPFGR